MIDEDKYLLTQLTSECCEVGHRATKAIQFGMKERQKGEDNNHDRLVAELVDLLGTVTMLRRYGIITITDKQIRDGAEAKVKRIEKYMQYAQQIGELQFKEK